MHQIRLHGPWEVIGPKDAAPRTVTMPQDWISLFSTTAGTARFIRWFHSPTNLDPDETVWLSLAGLGGTGTIAVNGIALKEFTTNETSFAVDVTAVLKLRNRLDIELRHDPVMDVGRGGLYGEIAVMIESVADFEDGPDGD
jgi:hypothetical protein